MYGFLMQLDLRTVSIIIRNIFLEDSLALIVKIIRNYANALATWSFGIVSIKLELTGREIYSCLGIRW
jgi:hypothetical protein